MATTKSKKSKKLKKKPVRLRVLLKAIKTRRKKKSAIMTQADYAVALDRVVRAIGRSQPGLTVKLHAVRVL